MKIQPSIETFDCVVACKYICYRHKSTFRNYGTVKFISEDGRDEIVAGRQSRLLGIY